MKFLLDENVDARLIAYLEEQGHDVKGVVRDYQSSLTDPFILALAHSEQRVMITNDRDFGDIVFHQGQAHAGVIYLRLRSFALEHIQSRVDAAIATQPDSSRSFLVVSDRRIRLAHVR
jgi:predicted nuclease of predicted toxin-antitoxin system